MGYATRNVLGREEPTRSHAFPRLHGRELDREPEFGGLLSRHVTWAPWDVSRCPGWHRGPDNKSPTVTLP